MKFLTSPDSASIQKWSGDFDSKYQASSKTLKFALAIKQ